MNRPKTVCQRCQWTSLWGVALATLTVGSWLASGPLALAAPANDNWASAQVLTGGWGSVANNNTGATAEPGEPSHAGFAALNSIWYSWTAPSDGEVSVDTFGSLDKTGAPLDTVLAVYVGTNVTRLLQVAANDDIYPFAQNNNALGNFVSQPYTGPSALKFNATGGSTYYFAVDTKFGPGATSLSWAFHPSGMFRFASEDASRSVPLYQVSENESQQLGDASTISTYYNYDVPGALVSITRVGGAVGRVLVDYATTNLTSVPKGFPKASTALAVAGKDYTAVSGTLTFDDWEMTKRILVPIISDFGKPNTNRVFSILLSNPRLDPNESPDVSAPRVDPSFATAYVQILDVDIDPVFVNNFDTNNAFVGPTNSVFNFEKAHYVLPEDVNDYYGTAGIWVDRSGPTTDSVTLNYRINNFLQSEQDPSEENNNTFALQPGSDYATPTPANSSAILGTNSDFVLTQGTLMWGANDGLPKRIAFTVVNDNLVEFNEDFHIDLYELVNGAVTPVGTVNECSVTILFDDQDAPAGSVDEFYNADYGANMKPAVVTTPPQNPHPGTDGVVYSLVIQPDGNTVIGGNFLSYNTTPRGCIARFGTNGVIDRSFNPGTGANDFISTVVLDPSGQFYIAGGFSSYNGVQRNGVARLNSNGSLDGSYNPGLGADGAVWAAVEQGDGKLIIAGDFQNVNSISSPFLARLNTDGSVDTSFVPTANAPNGTIWSLALQPDGKIIIGGEFTGVGGTPVGGIARLNTNGTIDVTYNLGTGLDGVVYAMLLRGDGKLWLAGEFNNVQLTPRKRFARLNANGTLDTTFDPGASADGTIYSIATDPSGLIYLGGMFTSFNGTHRMGFTRLNTDGTVDTSFLDTAYNQFAGLHRARYSDPVGTVFTSAVQQDGSVLIGGSFTQVGGGQADPNIRVDPHDPPNAYNADVWTEPKSRDGLRNRGNIAKLVGGATPGPGNIGLTFNSYSANESQGQLSVALVRQNGTLGYAAANFSVLPGLAQAGLDYTYYSTFPIYLSTWGLGGQEVPGPLPSVEVASTRQKSDGLLGPNLTPTDIFGHFWYNYLNAVVTVNVINNNNAQGSLDTVFQLANPVNADQFYLGGENIPLGVALGRSSAPFTVINDTHSPGVLGFGASTYSVNESSNTVTINVVRTNGTYGTVSAAYVTTNGTATAGVDYTATSGSLTFFNGQTNKTITIPIINDGMVTDDETFQVRLYNVNGGATLGLTPTTVIINQNYPVNGRVNFTAPSFTTNENAGVAQVTVKRGGGSQGTLAVTFATADGTARSGIDYNGVTNVLTWTAGDSSPKTVNIPLIDNGVVDGNLTVLLQLRGATVNGVTNSDSLGSISNAFLTILDSDSYGTLAFNRAVYNANENGGPATITVTRSSGIAQAVTVNFATAGGVNVSAGDYTPTNGILTFGPGEISKSFQVQVVDNQFVNLARSVRLVLSNAVPVSALGTPNVATLNLIDDETYVQPPGSVDTTFLPVPGFNDDVYALALQPNGSILAAGNFTLANNAPRSRIARLMTNGTLDATFSSSAGGADAAVRSLVLQSDGKVLLGGFFSQLNGVNRSRIGRLLGNGAIDTGFNPGSGADGVVYALSEVFVGGQRKLLVGGAFLNYNGVALNGLGRLNDDGSLDTSFSAGLGVDATIYAILPYPTNSVRAGQLLIAGDFTTYNGVGVRGVARIFSNGALDPTFNLGAGPDNSVRTLALQTDELILAGGLFTNISGTTCSHLARLTPSGGIDTAFNFGVGANDLVSSIVLQPDGRILLGGQFTSCSAVNRQRIARLNTDGTLDPAINFGLGANAFISALVQQPDDRILVAGGFTTFDGSPYSRLVRLYGRSVTGSGAVEFDAGNYQVDENGTNATVLIRRRGGSANSPAGPVQVTFTATNGTAVAGVNFTPVTSVLNFPFGEVYQQVSISVTQDFKITPDLTVQLSLSNPQPAGDPTLGYPTLGAQPNAVLTIFNDDSGVSFSSPSYQRNEDAADGKATLALVRTGSSRVTSSATVFTTTNGTAVAGVQYYPATNVVTFLPTQTSNFMQVPVIHDPTAQGNRTVILQMTNLNNALLLEPSQATLTIVDVEHFPGQLQFSQTNYVVGEGDGALAVSIVRSNGISGIVSVNFATLPGTAQPMVDYVATNGVLTFADGETNKTITVGIVQGTAVKGNQMFSLILSNATGGASIVGSPSVPVTIINNNVGVGFASPAYVVSETAGTVSLTVMRQNGSNQITQVGYVTTNFVFTTTNNGVVITNIGALAGTNYVAVTNSLTFGVGETLKSFNVPILHDPRVTGDLPFAVDLFSPTNLSDPTVPAQLMTPAVAVVTVLDSESGLAFTNSQFTTTKSATNVLITVVRSNANTGIVSVNYATAANGSAAPGVDYVTTSGTLTFSNGITSQNFSVPIINNQLVAASNLTFSVLLTNATPTNIAKLIPPSLATVTITNDLAGLSFSSAGYTVNENGGSITINVLRTGFTNSTVSVAYSTADGTGQATVNYVPTSGFFVFTNGETVKSFTVTVIDDGVVNGDKTVLLNLSNPGGKAVLVNPSASTLTILDTDGTSVVPAGSSLVSESGPVNGVIDSNETVTVLFALRAAGGTNTVNLVSTLLATNGVINPSGPQNYGALIPHGPSVFRPYTFKANGTNGQIITAVFALQDGATSLSNAVFNFRLGTVASVFANPGQIIINDFSNATPYPSIINVSGLGGAISKATVTITNLSHSSPSDIDMLLVSPSGLKSYLMAKCGGNNAVNQVTLTFDDAYPSLTTGQILSGTNRPTALAVAPPPFAVPAPPAPYNTNLSVFAGSNPNGNWALYVIDDTRLDAGVISNGWILNLTASAPVAADLGVTTAATAASVVVSSNISFIVTVTNYGPSSASGVVVSDALPAGTTYVSSSPSAGNVTINGSGQLTWSIASLGTNAYATNLVVVQTASPGLITNSVSVTGAISDGNPDNNSAQAVVTVVMPSADLSLAMSGTPNPTVVGGTVTYNLTVTNAGPATAVGVTLVNTLPPGMGFLSALPTNAFVVNGALVTFTNLGSLGSGSTTNVVITVQALVPGTQTNVATVTSSVFDPLKAGNTAGVKTEVEGVQLAFQHSGNSLTISWPISVVNYNLESATNLSPPVIWTVISSNTPPVGGQMSVTVPVGGGSTFFRLRGTGP